MSLTTSSALDVFEAATLDETGALVRRIWTARAERDVATAGRVRPPALLLIDLDHFKRCNDTFGHLAGDHVLAEVVWATRTELRHVDLIGRFGGDELAVLLNGYRADRRVSETADAIDRRCAETIGSKCSSLGDHRRCASSSCTVASRWREPVRQAGMEAARAAGAVWAVVSTIENEIEVIGTETNLGRARSRQSMIQLRAGILPGSAFAGRVYVVRGTDGGFL